jgi:hypothetical protein
MFLFPFCFNFLFQFCFTFTFPFPFCKQILIVVKQTFYVQYLSILGLDTLVLDVLGDKSAVPFR